MSSVAQSIQGAVSASQSTSGVQGPQIYTVKHGDSVQRLQVPSFAHLVTTPSGKRIILTNHSQQPTSNAGKLHLMQKNL